MKMLTLIHSGILLLMLVLYPADLAAQFGLYTGCPIYNRFTYLFMHGNFMHLAVNVYSLLILAFICDMRFFHFTDALLVAVLLPDSIITETPIIGMSTMIYTITGMIVMSARRRTFLILVNLAIITMGMFLTGIAGLAHLWCFFAGLVIGLFTAKTHG